MRLCAKVPVMVTLPLMKITLLLTGKSFPPYIKEGIEFYEKRINFYMPFEIKILPEVKLTGKMTNDKLRASESSIFLKNVNENDFLVLLDEYGKQLTSMAFARLIEDYQTGGKSKVVFAIGGAYGFDDLIKKRANFQMSLSQLTFPHQLARLIFCEQLYRSFTIIKNEPYHHK
jgi:23S rRNA (pseudouridine1915-N3)-methyltransferase